MQQLPSNNSAHPAVTQNTRQFGGPVFQSLKKVAMLKRVQRAVTRRVR